MERFHHDVEYGEAGEHSAETHICMPAPTYWPMALSFGLMLLFAGLVTHWVVSLVGLLIGLRSVFGLWRNVIPNEEHEEVPINAFLRPAPIEVEKRSVIRLKIGEGSHRQSYPVQVRPYSAGVQGGIAGGVVMAVLAVLYGLIAQGSIWYPVNLLAGAVIPGIGSESLAQLKAFDPVAFVVALIGHAGLSILVGILYAAILPMFPRFAPFWAGILMPLVWSALIGSALEILNPALNARISWPWFVACQLGFGLVGGYVIARSTNIRTMQSMPFGERAGIEAGRPHDGDKGDRG